nr:olfactory receptor 57 [Tropidothorax elegans]
MSIESETVKGEERRQIYYDFQNENISVLVMGGVTILQNSTLSKTLNLFCFAVVYFLFGSTFVMSAITVVIAFDQKALMCQALFTIGTLCVGVGLTCANHVLKKDLDRAAEIIRNGVYHYRENMYEEYLQIRKQNVEQNKFTVTFFNNMFFCCGFGYIAIFPIIKLFLTTEESNTVEINEYLPIPLYLPFKTDSVLNYALVFLANGVTLTCLYSTYASHIQIYVTCALQLTAEIEVLNYSLENMESRAVLKMKNLNPNFGTRRTKIEMYSNQEFQNCLLNCLRLNVLHHHAILSFKALVGNYLEVINTIGIMLFSILMAVAIIIVLEDPTRNILLTMTLFGTIFGYLPMCWFGQLITNTSAKTMYSLYSTPWPYCNNNFKMILKVFITNTIQPIILRATWININVSLETFGDLLSGGYKATNVLR